MTPVRVLLEKLPGARRAGNGWSARCPAHDDSHASLSVSEGDDGRALVKCHAGCTVEAVVSALGLTIRDLMPDRDGPAPNRNAKRKPDAKTFLTANAAVIELERRHGKRAAQWTYYDATGKSVGLVVRWNLDGGKKDIRPVARHEDGWRIGAMPDPRPLYGLPEVAKANRVLVVEGEKCADAARTLGFIATTSAGGAQAAGKSDWAPLAGKEVWVLPDNDGAGWKYADAVTAILATLTPAPVVKTITLPGLSVAGDLVDWIAAHGAVAEPVAMRAELEALAAQPPKAQEWPEIESLDDPNLPEFPTDALPEVLRSWVEAESHAAQTPAALAGLLALAVCSATIARRVQVEPRAGWQEPVNLFVAVLLEPGNRKSAVFSDAIRPLRELEVELIDTSRPTIARQQSERRRDEARMRSLEKRAAEKDDTEAGAEAGRLAVELAEKPEPVLPRLLVDDATSEKLGILLAEQGSRIASMSPEGGVFDLMAGMYSKNGNPQLGVYLMGHSGDDLVTDRVSRKSLNVTRPALTCAYAIQPVVIRGLAENTAFRGRGLLARFLYDAPRSWIGERIIAPAPVPNATREAYRQVVRALARTEGETVLRLTSPASVALRAWETEIETMLGDAGVMELVRDWGAKLAGATVRLAAVLHCVEHGPTGSIGAASLTAAIKLARHLIPHAEAVLGMMQAKESSCDADAYYILRWIERGCRREFTKRDAHQHGKRRFPKVTDIDPVLAELTRRGYIRLRTREATGPGRPSSPTYEVNPALFANEVAEKRSQNSHNSPPEPETGSSENIESASGHSGDSDFAADEPTDVDDFSSDSDNPDDQNCDTLFPVSRGLPD